VSFIVHGNPKIMWIIAYYWFYFFGIS